MDPPMKAQIPHCLSILRHSFFFFLMLPLFGQTNEEVFREYQFNFNLPGARANGMGGAFIGLADDATSSFTNPAGLAYLMETAVTLDWRNQHINGSTGNISGFFNTSFDVDPRSLDQAAFFSFNTNYHGWYFGLFRHQFANERQTRHFGSRSLSGGVERTEQREIQLDLEGINYGLGVGRRFGDFKLGLAINHLVFEASSSYKRTTFTRSTPLQAVAYTSGIDNTDREWGYTLGVLHEIGTRFSWGAVLRANPTFNLKEDILEEVNGQPVFVSDDTDVPFVVPDVLGAGLRYKPRPDMSLLFDFQRVFYSQIYRKGFVIVESVTENDHSLYNIDDTDEFHAGFEWLIPTWSTVWVARAGYYHNPLHALTYQGSDPATIDRFSQIGLTNENHYTFGGGWVYRNTFEIDISANFWENGREIAASFIWRKK